MGLEKPYTLEDIQASRLRWVEPGSSAESRNKQRSSTDCRMTEERHKVAEQFPFVVSKMVIKGML